MTSSLRIAHIIVRLGTGGAERSLQQLINGTADNVDHHVICFGQPTPLSAQMQRDGIAVTFVDYRLGPIALLQAQRRLRSLQPDIVQGWMYYGCVLASLLRSRVKEGVKEGLKEGLKLPRRKIIWSIRHNLDDYSSEPLRIRSALQLLRRLSADLVIYNSHAGCDSHAFLAFKTRRQQVIVNGVDTARFQPDEAVRQSLRMQYQIAPEAMLIGLVARFHPDKGVDDFLQVIAQLRTATAQPLRFVLVGPAMTEDNPALITCINRAGLNESDVLTIGPVQDLSQFMPALDLLVSASRTEALPNVVLEAMACAVPVVATRVGDVAKIIDDAARLAAPSDVDALTTAVSELVQADPAARQLSGQRNRQRVVDDYSLDLCLNAYLRAYRDVV